MDGLDVIWITLFDSMEGFAIYCWTNSRKGRTIPTLLIAFPGVGAFFTNPLVSGVPEARVDVDLS
jgi:hypothetical protein